MRSLLKLLVLHNPFYLLSALCMLVGCYTLNHALGLRPGEPTRLLVLLFTLNLYEVVLIGLALLLVRRSHVLDDGRTLLLLETLEAMAGSLAEILRALTAWPRRLVQRSTQEWGVLAVGSAFVLLAVGAWVSLLKGRARSQEVPARR